MVVRVHGSGLRIPRGRHGSRQRALVDVPARRQLELLARRLLRLGAHLHRLDRGVQRRACVGRKHGMQGTPALELGEAVALVARTLEHRNRDRLERVGARERLQQLRALVLVCLQERGELVLRQQHRARELCEVEADARLDRLQHLGLEVPDGDAVVATCERHLDLLQLPVGTVAGTPDAPARAVRDAIVAHELHHRLRLRRPPAQQVSSVLGREGDVSCIRQAAAHTRRAEARRVVVQREAQGIQQRALAGTRGAADREQPGIAQGRQAEVHREGLGERGEIAPGDGEDLHASCFRATASAISANAATSPAGGSAV
jgi:hypothetical protein